MPVDSNYEFDDLRKSTEPKIVCTDPSVRLYKMQRAKVWEEISFAPRSFIRSFTRKRNSWQIVVPTWKSLSCLYCWQLVDGPAGHIVSHFRRGSKQSFFGSRSLESRLLSIADKWKWRLTTKLLPSTLLDGLNCNYKIMFCIQEAGNIVCFASRECYCMMSAPEPKAC